MKKTVTMVLAIVLILGLFACGNGNIQAQQEPSAEPTQEPAEMQLYAKYESIIKALEAEEYDRAIAEIDKMKPEPDIIEVTITPDNFLDYYEIEKAPSRCSKDATGMLTSLSLFEYALFFKLKEPYYDSVLVENSHCEVGVVGSHDLKKLESVDWNTGDYVLSEKVYDDIKQLIWEQFKAYDYSETFSKSASGVQTLTIYTDDFLGQEAYWYNKDITPPWEFVLLTPDVMENDIYIPVFGNIDIIRAEGTLFFKNK